MRLYKAFTGLLRADVSINAICLFRMVKEREKPKAYSLENGLLKALHHTTHGDWKANHDEAP